MAIATMAPRLFDNVTMISTNANTRPSPNGLAHGTPIAASGAATKIMQSWMISRAVRLGSLIRSRQFKPHARRGATAKALVRIRACPTVNSLAV